jgi:hypothetical protein
MKYLLGLRTMSIGMLRIRMELVVCSPVSPCVGVVATAVLLLTAVIKGATCTTTSTGDLIVFSAQRLVFERLMGVRYFREFLRCVGIILNKKLINGKYASNQAKHGS